MIYFVTDMDAGTMAMFDVDSEDDIPVIGLVSGFADGSRKDYSQVPAEIDVSGIPKNRILTAAEVVRFLKVSRRYSERNGIGEKHDAALSRAISKAPQ